jgi:plastocyanin
MLKWYKRSLQNNEDKFKMGRNRFRYIFFLLFLYGCATPEERAIKVPEPDSTAANAIPTHPAGSGLHIIEIKDMKFQPESLSVKKGDTVMWTNHDIVTHDVTEEKSKAWTSGPLAPGQSWSLVVTESADYYCSIHVVMKGKLIVQ